MGQKPFIQPREISFQNSRPSCRKKKSMAAFGFTNDYTIFIHHSISHFHFGHLQFQDANLNGDYISDQLAAQVGGIGIAPGANINYSIGDAIFEATHGTAPDIAGKNIVNPCSNVLSGVMMLEHIGWNEAAALVEKALEESFSQGYATVDLARLMENGKPLGTVEFTENIVRRIYESK